MNSGRLATGVRNMLGGRWLVALSVRAAPTRLGRTCARHGSSAASVCSSFPGRSSGTSPTTGSGSRHTLFTGLVASLIVVAVTAAVLNEVLERRQRERWSVLAQYALFDLVRTARLVWTGLLELAGLVPDEELEDGALAAGSEAVLDTPRLAAAIDEMLASADRREQLHRLIAQAARSRRRGARTLGRCDGQLGHVRGDRRSPRRALQSSVLVGQRARRIGPARRAPESAEAEPSSAQRLRRAGRSRTSGYATIS